MNFHKQLYSWSPKTGNNTNVHKQENGKTMLHLYNEILLSNKKGWTIIYRITLMNLKHCAVRTKPGRKKHILWFSLYKILERAKLIYNDSSVSVIAWGVRWRGVNDCKTHMEGFVNDEMSYILIVVVVIRGVYLSKFTKIYL